MVRRLTCAAILGALLALAGWRGEAVAQAGPYVDPALRALIEADASIRARVAPQAGRGVPAPEPLLAGTVALDRDGPGGGTRVGVLARVSGPAAVAALRSAGAELGSVIGDIVTARVPVDALPGLMQQAEILMLEAARTAEVVHDSSMRAIRVDGLRQREGGVWRGTAGQGVIVGIYDTGADYAHRDFQDEHGSTRILGLWDQTVSGPHPPPAGFSYGQLCPPEALEAETCESRDLNRHGTHVAGTAAGTGAAGEAGSAFRYAGVAPAADLLIVKGGDTSFSFDRILDGVRWMFDEAERLGRPIVVNLSLGGRAGPRDGSTLFEQALDALVGPGRIVVAAAGNDGANGNTTPPLPRNLRHGMALPVAGVAQTFEFLLPPYADNTGVCNDFIELELWHAPEDRLTIAVARPDGSKLTAGHGRIEAAAGSGGRIRVDNATAGPDPNNGDRRVLIGLSDCALDGEPSGTPAAGVWTITVTPESAASGRPYHLWITGSSMTTVRGQAGFDNAYTVTTPGTAKRALTVGAYVTRLCWPTALGTVCYVEQEQRGDIARFSGTGPTRDGRLKPEIAAPGLGIVSALSRHGTRQSNRIVPGGTHAVLEGTSMAAPHVTGVVALLLQHRPELTPEEVKALVTGTAARDAFTRTSYTGEPAGLPNNQWGHGKLDAVAALEAIGALGKLTAVRITPATDTLPVGATQALTVTAVDAVGNEVSDPIHWGTSDPAVATVSAAGIVTAHAAGTAVVTATVRDTVASAEMHVVPPSTLIVDVEPAEPVTVASSQRGTRLPLLRLELRVDGHEGMAVRGIGFDVEGHDPGADILIVHDLDRDGTLSPGDTVLARAAAALTAATPRRILVEPDTLTLGARDSITAIVAIELSGEVPNGTVFRATFVPDETRAVALRSGREDRVEQPAVVVTSRPAATTVLAEGEAFTLSENPVRSGRVVFNFAVRPRVAGVYTLAGRRVADLVRRLETDGRIEWDLTNDDGSPVAAGVYLVVVDVGGTVIRERLIVARPRGFGG